MHFSTSDRQKRLKNLQFLTLLISKCASRHNCVHFFHISTSKSGPNMWCFCQFDLEMCFVPQRRALFSTSQLPKVVRDRQFFLHFWLRTARFSPQWRALFRHRHLNFFKVLWSWSALCILTWKCASRHSGVQFFMSHLNTWLRTRRFSEPTFQPSWATNHWKTHSESRLSYLFAHLHLLSSLSFSSLIFSLLDFSSLTLPTSAFLSVHIVGSFTSKLPSIDGIVVAILPFLWEKQSHHLAIHEFIWIHWESNELKSCFTFGIKKEFALENGWTWST